MIFLAVRLDEAHQATYCDVCGLVGVCDNVSLGGAGRDHLVRVHHCDVVFVPK